MALSNERLTALEREAERSRYLTVDAYGHVPITGDEVLAMVEEIGRARIFRKCVDDMIEIYGALDAEGLDLIMKRHMP